MVNSLRASIFPILLCQVEVQTTWHPITFHKVFQMFSRTPNRNFQMPNYFWERDATYGENVVNDYSKLHPMSYYLLAGVVC